MKTIIKPTDNLGGLLRIWAIPKTGYSLAGKDLTFADSSKICLLYCTPGSMSMEEKEEFTKAGSYFQTSLSGFIPKDTEETQAVLNDLRGKSFVVLYIDGNGSYKLAGNKNYPLRLSATHRTGQMEQQHSGYEILFSGKTRQRSVFVNALF